MNKKTAKKNLTAQQIEDALAMERKLAPVDRTEHSEKWWDKFCALTLDIYNDVGDNEDTECETHRGFVIVWNRAGVWHVEVTAGVVRCVASRTFKCGSVRPVKKESPKK